jgi:hypothetical protein
MTKAVYIIRHAAKTRKFVSEKLENVTEALRKRGILERTTIANYPQLAYSQHMNALFVELPAFARYRADYFSDDGFLSLQQAMLLNPEAGNVIEGTGGLRKLRHADPRRGKGKRGGLRVIYYWWDGGRQFWLFTLYDKDELKDLSAREKKALKDLLKAELEARR